VRKASISIPSAGGFVYEHLTVCLVLEESVPSYELCLQDSDFDDVMENHNRLPSHACIQGFID